MAITISETTFNDIYNHLLLWRDYHRECQGSPHKTVWNGVRHAEARGKFDRLLQALEGDLMNNTPKTGYLLKDRQERFNMKRAWFVSAWRIVDAQGRDMIQPWANTKGQARKIAKDLGITLIEISKE